MDDWVKVDNPLNRFRAFLETQKWWSASDEEEMKNRIKDNVINSFKRAESRQKHHLNEMFMDVYGGEEPWNIVCILSVSYRY